MAKTVKKGDDGVRKKGDPLQLPLPAAPFLPHSGPLLLIDQVVALDHEQRSGQVRTTLRAHAPYFVKGYFQVHWLVELMAQAVAALCQLLLLNPGGEPVNGYLIAIRSFNSTPALNLKVGEILIIDCRFEVEMTSIGHCQCMIHTAEGLSCGTAELTFLREAANEV